MLFEAIVKGLSATAHERKGLVNGIGHATDRPGWDDDAQFLEKYRQGFLAPTNVLERVEGLARREVRHGDETYADLIVELVALEVLSTTPRNALGEEELAAETTARIQSLLALPADWTRLDASMRDAYRLVLEAAWTDGVLTRDEMQLLSRIRSGFGLSHRAHWVLEREARAFSHSDERQPSPAFPPPRLLDSSASVDAGWVQSRLGRRGVVRYNLVRSALVFPVVERLPDGRTERELLALPDEMAQTVRQTVFQRDLPPAAYQKLLQTTALGGQTELGAIAEAFGLATARSLEERRRIVLASRIRPSEILELFSRTEPERLAKAASELGARVYKQSKRNAESILSHLQTLPEWEHMANPEHARLETLLRNYELLARRDYSALRERGLIRHDGDVDKLFEDATHFLFSSRLKLDTSRDGRDAEDGRAVCADGRMLLWDNKSVVTEKGHVVELAAHESQFRAYVDRARKKARVVAFLVIGPAFSDSTSHTAMNLEIAWQCEVAAISAKDLHWLAETWSSRYAGESLSIDFFASSGVLKRRMMEDRLKLRDWRTTATIEKRTEARVNT